MRNCTAAPAAQSDTITAASDSAPSTSHTSNKPSSLSVEQQPGWQESVDQLQGMGFSQVEAEQRVQRAFGWGAKARSYWRHEKVGTQRLNDCVWVVGHRWRLMLVAHELCGAKLSSCPVDVGMTPGTVKKLSTSWNFFTTDYMHLACHRVHPQPTMCSYHPLQQLTAAGPFNG